MLFKINKSSLKVPFVAAVTHNFDFENILPFEYDFLAT